MIAQVAQSGWPSLRADGSPAPANPRNSQARMPPCALPYWRESTHIESPCYRMEDVVLNFTNPCRMPSLLLTWFAIGLAVGWALFAILAFLPAVEPGARLSWFVDGGFVDQKRAAYYDSIL